jgi:hypothetical protein
VITECPARAGDDWSVPWSGGCGCELYVTVKNEISAAELPVKHEIWKFGSPRTLGADQD